MNKQVNDIVQFILLFVLAGSAGFWIHLLFWNPRVTGLAGVLIGVVCIVNRESLQATSRWIPYHLHKLWKGEYPTLVSVICLIGGTFAVPVVFLIAFVPILLLIAYIATSTLSPEKIGEAVNIPLLAYVLVAMVGTWTAASREQVVARASTGSRSLYLILAKVLVAIYTFGWLSIMLGLIWLWFFA